MFGVNNVRTILGFYKIGGNMRFDLRVMVIGITMMLAGLCYMPVGMAQDGVIDGGNASSGSVEDVDAQLGVSTHASSIPIDDATKPALKQGMAYSILDSGFNYLTTYDVYHVGGFNVEFGYAGRAKNTQDKAVAVLSYNILDAKKMGVTIPLLDLIKIRPGVYVGSGRISLAGMDGMKDNNEYDFGFSVTFIDFSIKF
jgi:hypothetical protein